MFLFLFIIWYNKSTIYALLYGSPAHGNSSICPNRGNKVGGGFTAPYICLVFNLALVLYSVLYDCAG